MLCDNDEGIPGRCRSAERVELDSSAQHGGGAFPIEPFHTTLKILLCNNSMRLISNFGNGSSRRSDIFVLLLSFKMQAQIVFEFAIRSGLKK
jgi:hypothetical protein